MSDVFDINKLKAQVNQSLGDRQKLPKAYYKPLWVNNQTRLNASNFNDLLYKSVEEYTQLLANNAYEVAADSIDTVIENIGGWKNTTKNDDITNTSELHNYSIDNEGIVNNTVNGAYQSVFGNGNILTDQEGQFVTGTFAKTTVEQDRNPLLFVIGNGTDKNNTSNAFSISTKGEMNIKDIISDDANITNLTSNNITASVSMSTPVITIENTPTNNKHGTNKKYVDDSITTEKNRAVGVENKLRTDLDSEISRAKSEENSIRAIASSAFHFKGNATLQLDSKGEWTGELLDDSGKVIEGNSGDVYQVLPDKEYAFNASATVGQPKWVELGFNIDLSPYIKTTEAESKIATAKSEAILTANTYTDTQVAKKQDTLVSGTNIKTINGATLLGSGNIVISGSGTVDDALSTTSENAVQNKVITQKINSLDFGDVDKTTSQNKVNMYLPGEGNLTFTLRNNEAYVTISETTQENVPIILRNQREVAQYEDEATSKAYVDAQGAAVALGEFVNTQYWTVPDAVSPLPFGIRRNINILNPDPVVTQSQGKITYDSDTDAFTISGEITTSVSVGGIARLHAIGFSNVFDQYQQRSTNIPYTFYIDHRSGSYSVGSATITLFDNTTVLETITLDNTEQGGIQTVRLTRVPTYMVLQIKSAPYTFNDYSVRFGLLTSDTNNYVKHDANIVYGDTQLITVFRQSPGSTISNRLFDTTVSADGEPSILNVSQQQIINAQKNALIRISTQNYFPYNLKYLQDISTSLTEPYTTGTKIATKNYVDSQVHIIESGTVVVLQDEDPLGPEKDVPSGRHTPDVTWHYRKYSDNTIDMWAAYRQNNVVLTSADGALYSERYSRYPKLPFKLKSRLDKSDMANVQLNVRGINWLMWGNGSLSIDQTEDYVEHAQYQVVGTTAFSEPQEDVYVLVNIFIKGELYTD